MGKQFTTTITARCQKEHTCVCCGAVYSYPLTRKVTGTAANAEQSAANAEAAAAKAMANEVDPEPCPTCGLLQPDMVGQRRARVFRRVFWLGLIAFVTLVSLCAANAVRMNVAVWVGAAACAVAAVILTLTDLRDPNRSAEMNREVASGRVASGAITHAPGKFVAGTRELARFPRSVGHKLVLMLVLAAVGLAAVPELIRASRGWPANDECYPPVVGPGDETRVYMNEKVTSLKSYWRGTPIAVARVAGVGGRELPMKAKTNQNNWPDSISVKSSQKNSSSTPWVEVVMPNDPAVAGRTVECAIHLGVTYPASVGSNSYEHRTARMSRNVPINVAADAMAGARYSGWWWKGTVVAMAVVLVGAWMLIGAARAMERRARPTRVLPPAVGTAGAMPV